MTNVVLSTHWTDGDVLPFIRLGKFLRLSGHRVTLISHCYYRKNAEDADLDFAAWDSESEYRAWQNDMSNITFSLADIESVHDFRKKYESKEVLLKEFHVIEPYCHHPDTVIVAKNRSSMAALLASECFSTPLIQLFMNPFEVGSLVSFSSLYSQALCHEANDVRGALGLAPIESWLAWHSAARQQMALWPEWYYGIVPEWPGKVQNIGFPAVEKMARPTEAIPKAVEAILERDSKPIIISGGTSRQLKEHFYPSCIEACGLLGKETIVVTRYPDFLPPVLPPNVSWFDHLPLGSLLGKMGVLVNHGGIGTVSEAIFSGLPQLVLPYHVDRPLNASIVVKLGLGSALPASRWTPSAIAEQLTRLLEPKMRQTCQEFARTVPRENPFAAIESRVDNIVGKPEFALHHADIQAQAQSQRAIGEAALASNDAMSKKEEHDPTMSFSKLSPSALHYLLQKKRQQATTTHLK